MLKSQKLYRELAANFPNGAAFVFDHELRYRMAEGQAVGKAGMKSKDFEGKTIWEAHDSKLASGYEPCYRSASGGKSFQWEHVSRCRHYETQFRPLRDGQGKIFAVGGISADVTERKRAEEALSVRCGKTTVWSLD